MMPVSRALGLDQRKVPTDEVRRLRRCDLPSAETLLRESDRPEAVTVSQDLPRMPSPWEGDERTPVNPIPIVPRAVATRVATTHDRVLNLGQEVMEIEFTIIRAQIRLRNILAQIEREEQRSKTR